MDGPDQRLAENYGTVIGLLSGKADDVPAISNSVYTDNVTPSRKKGYEGYPRNPLK